MDLKKKKRKRSTSSFGGANSQRNRTPAQSNIVKPKFGGTAAGSASVGSAGVENPRTRESASKGGTLNRSKSISRTNNHSTEPLTNGSVKRVYSTPTASQQKLNKPPQGKVHDEPAKNSLSDPTRAEPQTCKKRPDSRVARAGPGGSREFIPWCKKT